MNEEILRTMIRESIARRLSQPSPALPATAGQAHADPRYAQPLPFSAHPSHFRYTLPESSGPCYIEPASHCSHCGYCESHGH